MLSNNSLRVTPIYVFTLTQICCVPSTLNMQPSINSLASTSICEKHWIRDRGRCKCVLLKKHVLSIRHHGSNPLFNFCVATIHMHVAVCTSRSTLKCHDFCFLNKVTLFITCCMKSGSIESSGGMRAWERG